MEAYAPQVLSIQQLHTRPLLPHQAQQLHQLYQATPGYFELLGSAVPTLAAVQADVLTAQHDPRRHLELLCGAGGEVLGYLDYKVGYPAPGDLTINLLLIRQDCQHRQLGEWAVRDLESRLPAGTTRILAGVLGDNRGGVRFWERLGYHFELDARPALCWYAKRVGPPLHTPLSTSPLSTRPLSATRRLLSAGD